jgi:hypothetical protein
MLGPERPVFGVICTSLRQGRLPRPSGGHAQRTGQLAASTRWWPYPTHWVTGAPAARRLSDDRAPRPGSTTSSYPAATLRPGNSRQPPHYYHATSACDQRTHHYISLPAGTNGPFQGPTNFTEWIVYQNNGIPLTRIALLSFYFYMGS